MARLQVIRLLTARKRARFLLLLVLVVSSALFATALLQRDRNFFGAESQRPIATDFIAFYAAGRIIADGEGDRLYDSDFQHSEQTRLLGREAQSFAPFAYPAWVIAPYVVLSDLSYISAFLVALLTASVLLIPTILMLRDVSPTVRDNPLLVGLALAAFWPFFWGMTNGQPTAFWLLCLVGLYAALRRRRDTTAGIWLGLLMGKPQLAALLFVLLGSRRRWRIVGVAALLDVVLTLVGVALAGNSWPRAMLRLVTGDEYNIAEIDRAGILHISLSGVVAKLIGPASPWTAAIVVPLTLAVGIGVVRTWRRGQPEDVVFPLQFGLAVAAAMAVSPHALFYDVPLLLLPVLAIVDQWRADPRPGGEIFTPRRRLALLALFLAGFGWQLSWVIGLQPLAILPVVIGIVTVRAMAHTTRGTSSIDHLPRSRTEVSVAA